MTTIHGAVILDKVNSTYHGHIASIQAPQDLDNGVIVQLGDLVSGERELYAVHTPDATSINNDPIYLHATPETTYLAGQVITDFYVPNGKDGRAMGLKEGDIFTVTQNMLTGTIAVDNFVAPVAGALTLAASATLPTTRFIGKIIEVGTIFGQTSATIRVVKN